MTIDYMGTTEKLTPSELIVGIDLACYQLGISWVTSDHKLYQTTSLQIQQKHKHDFLHYLQLFHKQLVKPTTTFCNHDQTVSKVLFLVELANFKNAKITNQFHFLAGLLFASVAHGWQTQPTFSIPWEMRFFNADQWFEKFWKNYCEWPNQDHKITAQYQPNWRKMPSLVRKQITKAYVQNLYANHHFQSQDAYDSVAIALFGKNCLNSWTSSALLKKSAKQKQKLVIQQWKKLWQTEQKSHQLQSTINVLQAQPNSVTNQKMLQKLTKKLAAYQTTQLVLKTALKQTND